MVASNKKPSRRISGRSSLWIVGIVLVAIGLRALYFQEQTRTPELLTPLADAAFHDYWAKGIASNEWTPPTGEADPRIREVPFLRPPGYPYFLALIYRLFGSGPWAVRICQMLFGVLNCYLAYRLGWALFRPAVGLVAAALCATSWALIYFEGELQAPVLIQTLALATLLALQRWSVAGERRFAWGAGILAGLLAVTRANALLFLPVAVLWMPWAWRQGGRRGAPTSSIVAFVMGVVLAIAPVTIRNLLVSGEPVLVSANGAINLYIGNNETADGMTARIPDLAQLTGLTGWSWFSYDRIVQGIAQHEEREMTYTDVSKFFNERAMAFVRDQPRDFVRLTLRKAALFWGPDEISNNKSIRFEKANSRALRHLPPFPFVLMIATTGLLWIALDVRSGRQFHSGVSLMGAFLIIYFVSFLPFLAAARFRVPLHPFLFLFGAYALARFAEEIREGRWGRTIAMALVAGFVFLGARVSTIEGSVDQEWWHTDRGAALARSGNHRGAIREFQSALAVNPGYVDARDFLTRSLTELGREDEAIREYQEVLKYRPTRFDLRIRLGELLLHRGRYAEAVTELAEAVRANSDNAVAHFQLGRALLETGQYDPAIEAFYSSLGIEPGQPLVHVNLGVTLSKMGDHDGAVREIERALEIDPFVKEAHLQLGTLWMEAGNFERAVEALEEAVRVEPKYVEAHIQLGTVLNEQGNYAKAVSAYEKATKLDDRNAVLFYNLAGSLGNLARYEDALSAVQRALEIDPGHQPSQQRLQILRDLTKTQGATTG